jgi:Fic family protein
MRTEDFATTSPGVLVPTIEGALAFVPHALPRHLDLDWETFRLLAGAENSLGRLEGLAGKLVNPFLVSSPLLHREALISSRMEGTVTTPEELVVLEAAGIPTDKRNGLETREVLNYVHALEHGLSRLKELPVCLRLIKELHEVLVQGVRGERERPGEFREVQNWIRGRGDDSIRSARYVPPPAPEMLSALKELEEYINHPESVDDLPLLIELALIHYQFETIHPFRDGNGRIGRLLVPLILSNRKHMHESLLYLSRYFEQHRDTYMDLMLRVSQTGDWNSWVKFFLRGVVDSANDAIEQAEGLLALRDHFHRMFQAARSSALLQKLIDRLFRNPAITIGQAAELLEITHAAASYNINKLKDVGILEEVPGRPWRKVFIATGILEFLHDANASIQNDSASRAATVASP